MNKGFTLIELIVVIAIIGTLSALLLPNFMGARERARDVQRKSDITQIQKALEIERQDKVLPTPPFYIDKLPNPMDIFENSISHVVYMNKLPGDPKLKLSGGGQGPYYYERAVNNISYKLAACLENKADPDGQDCASTVSDFSTVTGYACDSGKCYVVNEP